MKIFVSFRQAPLSFVARFIKPNAHSCVAERTDGPEIHTCNNNARLDQNHPAAHLIAGD